MKHDLKYLVYNNVEETLKTLWGKEVGELVNTQKYERSQERQKYRSGHYTRNLHAATGEVELIVPMLKDVPLRPPLLNATAAKNLLLKNR